MKPEYIQVCAAVRYWEDAEINGEDDVDGTLTPFRVRDNWCPVIRLSDGVVMNWPQGMTANFYFKVCDAGEYWLLDDNRCRVGKWAGFYVPNAFLCHGDNGYGDYIIFNVDQFGRIEGYRQPEIEWFLLDEDDSEEDVGGSGWIPLRAKS